MESGDASVYDLLTALSEKFAAKQHKLPVADFTKKLRSKCYEVLLFNNNSEVEDDCFSDIYCKFYGWLFNLKQVNCQEDLAKDIEKHLNLFEANDGMSKEHKEDVLSLLYKLKKDISRNTENDSFSLPLQEKLPWLMLTDQDFQLDYNENPYVKFNYSSFNLNKYEQDKFVTISLNQNQNKENEKREPLETMEHLDLWKNIHLDTKLCERNWENRYSCEEQIHLSFLSESKSNYHLLRTEQLNRTPDVNHDEFVRDLKNVMVGIPSKIFQFNEQKELCYISASVKGFYSRTLDEFSKNFVLCGNKYIKLKQISEDNSKDQIIKASFIYKEFCASLRRYLTYYSTSVFTISNQCPLSYLNDICKKLLSQLSILFDLCENVYFNSKIDSVKLLNYLYKIITTCSNRDVLNLLLSILSPCFQVYISHFLQPWLYDGTLNDPHNEFFVIAVTKHYNACNRFYWTKRYIINSANVPDFLIAMQNRILLCGKSAQLLKHCAPANNMLAVEKPNLKCCITSQQLQDHVLNLNLYNLAVYDVCGKPFSVMNVFRKFDENKEKFLTMVAYKRTAMLKRIELEKLQKLKERKSKKEEEYNMLRQQYLDAIQEKNSSTLLDIARDIKANEINLKLEALRDQAIEQEANDMINYYETLMQEAECRQKISELQIVKLKQMQLDVKNDAEETETPTEAPPETNLTEVEKNIENKTDDNPVNDSAETCDVNHIPSSHSLDLLNANVEELQPEVTSVALDTFEQARRNKEKVMSTEFDILYKKRAPVENETKKRSVFNLNDLTEAQRNKLKVMSSEFDIDYRAGGDMYIGVNKTRRRNTKRSNLDNEKILNNNATTTGIDNANVDSFPAPITPMSNADNSIKLHETPPVSAEKSLNLNLDLKTPSIFQKFLKTPNFELGKSSPMSVDSTPMSDMTPLSRIHFSKSDAISDFGSPSGFTTSTTFYSKDCFNFGTEQPLKETIFVNYVNKSAPLNDMEEITQSGLHYNLERSISLCLDTQLRLVNNEMLRYFVSDLKYLKLLKTLRNYFFLMDGEFGRNLAESLFEAIYSARSPLEVLDIGNLGIILNGSIYSSHKIDEDNVDNLSFKINRLPKRFDLRDPNILKCLTLTYKVSWPLNILLPADSLEKYNEIFDFLMKLQRVSWVLKRIFNDLKMLTKQPGRRAQFLTFSDHYQSIHKFRHLMTQFVQAFQNYIVGDVLQCSWKLFEKSLMLATDLDSIYELHTVYIKNILFMCFLKHQSAPIKEALHKIFVVIFKFYDHLRSRMWTFDDGIYVHPNFDKLQQIYQNFEELVLYLFKFIRKATTTGYQKRLDQLLLLWDINNYYTNKLNSNTS